MLTASHFLDRQDADRISAAARAAMDATADAAVTGHGREGKQPGVMSHEERQSSGPSLSALSLFALLHVSKQPREGLPVVVDVLQEMVRVLLHNTHCRQMGSSKCSALSPDGGKRARDFM